MSSIIYFNTEKIKKYKGVDCILNGYFFNKDNFTKIMVNNKDVTDKTLFMGTTKNKDDIYIVLFFKSK